MPDTTRLSARTQLFEELRWGRPSREEANQLLDAYRTEVLAEWTEQAAQALLAVDPVEWALAGQHAGADAVRLLRRLAAAPTTPTTPCATCHGSGLDPADEGDYDPAVQRHNPSTIGPCPACCGSRTNPTSSKEN